MHCLRVERRKKASAKKNSSGRPALARDIREESFSLSAEDPDLL
jgi:hypothetical protein